MSTWLITDERMIAHDPGGRHPERPARLSAIMDRLQTRPVEGAEWKLAGTGSREAVERVHPAAYIEGIESKRGLQHTFDPDTRSSKGTVEAAWLAVGAATQAVDALIDGDADNVFALVRPPGHHAEASTAMGFCFFNNIAIAAAHARARGLERVMVIDWDVHHGNGTQNAFYDRRDVYFFSSHQAPAFPGTGHIDEIGRGAGEGFTLNLPLPPGLEDGDYLALYREVLEPAAEAFDPQLLLVSAGFDAHRDDPLAGMELSALGFAGLCGLVKGIAERHAGGRLGLLLEGGYDLVGLAESVRACTQVLTGATPPPAAKPSRQGERILAALRRGPDAIY